MESLGGGKKSHGKYFNGDAETRNNKKYLKELTDIMRSENTAPRS